jgi:hypothetical protein
MLGCGCGACAGCGNGRRRGVNVGCAGCAAGRTRVNPVDPPHDTGRGYGRACDQARNEVNLWSTTGLPTFDQNNEVNLWGADSGVKRMYD